MGIGRCHHPLVLQSHHLVFLFIVTAAIAVAFTTVVVVAAVDAEVLQLSSPRSLTLGDLRASAGIDGAFVIIVIAMHPPCAASAVADAIIDVNPPSPLPLCA